MEYVARYAVLIRAIIWWDGITYSRAAGLC